MYMYEERKQPSLRNLFLMIGIIVLFVVYGMISLSTEDPLWFWPVFREQPAQIVVNCYGETIEVGSSSGAFAGVTSAVNEMLSGSKRWDPVTMSAETYADYQSHPQMLAVEIHYRPAVRVHSFYKYYKNLDTLVVPVDGRHAQWNTVFGRLGDVSLAGALMVADKAALVESVASSGLCTPKNMSTLPGTGSQQ
jgi:hypothetical protein